jgi:hypothetical protein
MKLPVDRMAKQLNAKFMPMPGIDLAISIRASRVPADGAFWDGFCRVF